MASKEMTTCMLEAKYLAANIFVEAMKVFSYIENMATHFRVHTLVTNQMCPISEFLGPVLGLEFH